MLSKDLLELNYIMTSMNSSDGMTKPSGRILFNKHFDHIMGRLVPNAIKNEIIPDTSYHTDLHAKTLTEGENV